MWGLQLATDAMPIVDGARQRGLLVNRTHEKVVRMLPPLTINAADLQRATDLLDEVFASAATGVHA
jgi:acetylornithine/succinyldiaminopimelate/putrescine aminotransferase